MTRIDLLVLLLVFLVLTPFVVFLSVKLGATAYFLVRRRFRRSALKQKKGNQHGPQ